MKKLIATMMQWMLSCAEATRLASEALDRPLSGRERRALRLHFMLCHLCRRYDAQLRGLQAVLHRHPETFTRPVAGLSAAARARVVAKLRGP